MLILKGHRFRLDLDEVQASLCSRTAGTCRFLWNLALEQRAMAWSNGRHSVGYYAQRAELKDLKGEAPWMKEAPHHTLQETLLDLDRAFQNFFAGRASYPAFRKKCQRDSFRFPDAKQFLVDEQGQRVKLPKLGWVSFRNGHRIPGRPKPVQAPAVGVDLGVAQAMTTSNGEVLVVQGMTRAELRRLARLQRSMARKRKGSKNRSKARKRLAGLQARIARRRRDAIHKATTYLAKNHGRVVVEDLRVRSMTASAKGTLEAPGVNVKAKAGLNRAMLNVAFGETLRREPWESPYFMEGRKSMAGPARPPRCFPVQRRG